MKYYKVIKNETVVQFGEQPNNIIPSFAIEITPEEYERLIFTFNNRPVDTFESVYELKESGVYEPRPRTHEEVIDWYVQIIQLGTVTLDEIPQEYRAEVEDKLPVSEEDKMAMKIAEEVANG